MNRHIPNRHRGRQKINSGEKLFGDFRVRVVLPDQKPILWRTHAKPGHGYSAKNIEEMLDQVAEHLEKRFPSIEFRLVELKPNVFNFCYEGRKEIMKEQLNACPESARAQKIAEEICAKQGHKLSTYNNGSKVGANGMPEMLVINFCSNCGLSLSEVRGEIDARLDAAVSQRVSEQLAAMAAANKPAGAAKGPIELPKPVNSSSEPAPE